MCKIRSLAPSQRGKRPLLLDISQDVEDLNLSQDYTQESKRRAVKNAQNIQIPERKAVVLSDNEVHAVQRTISEHVS